MYPVSRDTNIAPVSGQVRSVPLPDVPYASASVVVSVSVLRTLSFYFNPARIGSHRPRIIFHCIVFLVQLLPGGHHVSQLIKGCHGKGRVLLP